MIDAMKQLFFLLLFISTIPAIGQTSTQNWETLSNLEYEKSSDEYGEIFIPKFGPGIKALEGKKIELSGYIIPFEGMFGPKKLIISSLPVASCFFLRRCRTRVSSRSLS